MKRWLVLSVLFALCGVVSQPCRGAGLIIIDDAHWWPGPIPPRSPPWPPRPFPPPPRPHIFAPLEVSHVNVHTRINDQLAVTSVDQEFYNPNRSEENTTALQSNSFFSH